MNILSTARREWIPLELRVQSRVSCMIDMSREPVMLEDFEDHEMMPRDSVDLRVGVMSHVSRAHP